MSMSFFNYNAPSSQEQQQLAEYNRQLSEKRQAEINKLKDVFSTAPSWLNVVGNGTPRDSYAITFAHETTPYTFVSDSVIERGINSDNGYTYWFTELLNQNNLKEFFKDAKRVDLGEIDQDTKEYVTDKMGQSASGYLIPGTSARFDGYVGAAPSNIIGGGIRGMGQTPSGDYVYLFNNPGGYVARTGPPGTEGSTTLSYGQQPRQRSGGLFGILEDIGGFALDFARDLGPLGTLALNLAVPGLGTGLAIGTQLGQGNIEGAIISGATGAVGQGIASAIAPEIASTVAELGLDPVAEKLVTDMATRSAVAGTMAALTGRDVETAMQNAALNAGIGSLMSPAGSTQEDIDAIMNLGGTPEQQAGTALLDYQTMFDKELSAAQDQTPQDIYPLDIPQEPPTSYETGIGLPGEEAAAQSQKGFGGTGNILGLEDYEEVAGKDLAEAQAQAGGPDVYLGTQEPAAPQLKLPSVKLPSAQDAMKQAMLGQAKTAQESYNQMLDQYLMSQPVSVPFIANIPQTDLEAMFSGQTPIYWQGQA